MGAWLAKMPHTQVRSVKDARQVPQNLPILDPKPGPTPPKGHVLFCFLKDYLVLHQTQPHVYLVQANEENTLFAIGKCEKLVPISQILPLCYPPCLASYLHHYPSKLT